MVDAPRGGAVWMRACRRASRLPNRIDGAKVSALKTSTAIHHLIDQLNEHHIDLRTAADRS
jgi:hypothetical protein